MNGDTGSEVGGRVPSHVARKLGGTRTPRFNQSGQAGKALGLFAQRSDSLSRCAILGRWASTAKWL